MTETQRPRRMGQSPQPRAKVWLERDGNYIFGRGISDILKAIDERGSIKRAAQSVGKSYRHVWARIKETEEALGAELVHTQVGGNDVRRSELTDLGRDLVRDFDRLRNKVLRLVAQEYANGLRATLERHRLRSPLRDG